MSNIKISELNELTKSNKAYNDYLPIVDTSTNETKKISVEGLTASNVELLAVVPVGGIAPEPDTPGTKYYSINTNKIYTATASETWDTPETPVAGIFYVVLEEKTTYTYDEENETLVSVGGGSGSEIVVGDEEPTEDTKMIIDTDAFDPQYSDITDEYSTANNKAYSCDYVNTQLNNKLSNDMIAIYNISNVTIGGNSQQSIGTLPSTYQNYSAYVVTFGDNAQWFTGGVNPSYSIFVRNNYSDSLTTNANIICVGKIAQQTTDQGGNN